MSIIRKFFILFFMVLSVFAYPKSAFAAETVIIFHGIARSSDHMKPLAKALQHEGFEVYNLDYPSTDFPLETLRDHMQRKISPILQDADKVHFVGYSMGGLLTRAILSKKIPNNLGHVVLIGTPNHGSEVADFLKNNWFYQKIYGPAGQQLTTKNLETENLFKPIDYSLGVIAGNATIDPISSWIIPNDDDGKVSIQSTKIAGMRDHITISSSHTFFPSNKEAQAQTIYFLKHGFFKRD